MRVCVDIVTMISLHLKSDLKIKSVCECSQGLTVCFVCSLSRESRENCSLLKEEVEGLRRKLERMQKTKEDLVNMELEKEVNWASICVSVNMK